MFGQEAGGKGTGRWAWSQAYGVRQLFFWTCSQWQAWMLLSNCKQKCKQLSGWQLLLRTVAFLGWQELGRGLRDRRTLRKELLQQGIQDIGKGLACSTQGEKRRKMRRHQEDWVDVAARRDWNHHRGRWRGTVVLKPAGCCGFHPPLNSSFHVTGMKGNGPRELWSPIFICRIFFYLLFIYWLRDLFEKQWNLQPDVW